MLKDYPQNNALTETIPIGTELVCPVCGKTFRFSEDCKYIINKQYVDVWQCFSSFVKEHTKNDFKQARVESSVKKSFFNQEPIKKEIAPVIEVKKEEITSLLHNIKEHIEKPVTEPVQPVMQKKSKLGTAIKPRELFS